jgi:hypothetical protein
MEELQLTLTPSRVDQRNFGVMLSNWRVGQVLNALVVDRMPSGDVLLNVGGREFATPLDLPLQAGSRLQLEVQQLQPQIKLKVRSNAHDAFPSQMTQSSNRQTSASGGSISIVNASPTSVTSLITAISIQPALRNLVSQTPVLASLFSALSAQSLQSGALSSSALSAAIGQSGLFNEANLASGRQNQAGNSLKTQVAQLRSAIDALPIVNIDTTTRAAVNSFSDLTNAALAHMTQQQLASLPQDSGGQRWYFDLPLSHGGGFVDLQIIVERDERSCDLHAEEAAWRVELSLTLPETGPLRATITLQGREVRVVLNSDSTRVRNLADASFEQLKERMVLSDFRVKSLSAQPMAEVSPTSSSSTSPSGGVEVRA